MRPASYYPSCGNPAVRLLVPDPWFCVIASRQFCLSRGRVFASILESNEDADSRRAEKELELAEFLDFRSCMRILSECRSRAILASRVSAGGRQTPGSPRTRTAARTELFDYLEGFYKGQRRHSALGYLSPRAFERRREQEAVAT